MANNATVLSVSAPAAVPAGQPFSATFTVQNTGDTTWSVWNGTAGYNLGTVPHDTKLWGPYRFALPAPVPPGATVTLTGSLTAPAAAGAYSLAVQMVQETVAWFGATGALAITVTPGPPPPPVLAQLPDPPADPLDLVAESVIQIVPYLGDAVFRTVGWTNASGRRLLVKKAYLWSGVDIGALCDVHLELRRHSDQTLLGYNQWDHYAAPTSPANGVYVSFDPHVGIDPGDGLDLRYMANVFNGPYHAAHQAAVWALYAPAG